MTSDMWPYALDLRGFPIVSWFSAWVPVGSTGTRQHYVETWRSYVVLPCPSAIFSDKQPKKSQLNRLAAMGRDRGWESL